MTTPKRLGEYELLSELGRGAMGVVYRAVDRRLHREVALKVLLGATDAAGIEAFHKEARAAARLRHPGIVVVYGAEVIDNVRAVSFELVDGGSLAQRLKREGPRPTREAARLIADLAAAVHAAHEQGIIHRDLKPANVLLEKRDGRPRLTDFGLARDKRAIGVTELGDIVGSPAYMAPEQARGENDHVGTWTDVWGLGAILYECLGGQPPYWGQSFATVLKAVRSQPVPPLLDLRKKRGLEPLPRDLQTICDKALSRNIALRYPTAAALQEDLERWLDGRPILARTEGKLERLAGSLRRHKVPIGVGLVVAGVVSVGATFGPAYLTRSRRRAESAALLARVGTGRDKLQREQAIFELSKDPATAPTDLLIETVMNATRRLTAVTRVRLLAVLEPRGDAERARQTKIVGLETALDELERANPWDEIPRSTLRIVDEARRRIGQRRTGDAQALKLRPSAILAAEQKRELGDDLVRGLVAVESLGRLGAAAAGPAIGRFLHADEDEEEDLVALTALGRLQEQRAIQSAFQSPRLRGRSATYVHKAHRLLAQEVGGKLPRFELLAAGDHRDLAQLLWVTDDKKGALEHSARAIELDPKGAIGWHHRARFHIVSKEWAKARTDIERAVELDPEQPEAHLNLGFVLSNQNETERALAACARAIELDPHDPRAWNVRGYIRMLKDHKGGLEDLTRSLELDAFYAEPWANRAWVKVQLQDFRGAIEDSTRALEIDGKTAYSWANRATAKANLGDFQGALADASRAIELQPRSADFLARRGHVRLVGGDLEGALLDVEQALSFSPRNDSALTLRGRAKLLKGDFEGARQDAEAALSVDPNAVEALRALGDIAIQRKDLKGAVLAYDRLLAVAPEDGIGLATRGGLKLTLGDVPGSLADYEKAASRPLPAPFFVAYAHALIQAREVHRALEKFDTAVALGPDLGMTWRARAAFHLRCDRLDAALSDAERALQVEPTSFEGQVVLGQVRYRRGELAEALKALRKALELVPPGVDARDLRADIADLERRR